MSGKFGPPTLPVHRDIITLCEGYNAVSYRNAAAESQALYIQYLTICYE